MKNINFIETYENALKKEECDYIIDFMNTGNRLRPGTIQKGVDLDLKNSFDVTLNFNDDHMDDSELKVNRMIYESLCNCIQLYKKSHPQLDEIAKWNLNADYNLQKYHPMQGYYALHCENQNPSKMSSSRVLAWMYYLNTITDGGGTYFDNYDLSMNAVKGRCVIWPAYWTHMHRSIVSKTETKYIATGWVSFVDTV